MSEIKPALSPEEWEYLETAQRTGREGRDTLFAYIGTDEEHTYVPKGSLGVGWNGDGILPAGPNARHALAALALHGQPFGFTWEDVDLLQGVAKTAYLMMENRPDGYWSGDVASADKLAADLADRIAALLPPREP